MSIFTLRFSPSRALVAAGNTLTIALVAAGVASCGGGSPPSITTPNGLASLPPAQPQSCTPNSPYAAADGAPTNGSLDIEKSWVYQLVLNNYLFYGDINNATNPEGPFFTDTTNLWSSTAAANQGALPGGSGWGSLGSFFRALLSFTPLKDKFSFSMPTAQWNTFINTNGDFGYGADWVKATTTTNGVLSYYIAAQFVNAGTPAGIAGMQRGDKIISIDGHSAALDANGYVTDSAIPGLLYPQTTDPTYTHTFVVQPASGAPQVTYSLTATNFTANPVPDSQVFNVNGVNYGYIMFNQHTASSEQGLINAINNLKTNNAQELILDVRYNGGGYILIASELAYMIAGPGPTNGVVFEHEVYNDKRTADTNSQNSYIPFFGTECLLNSSGNCTAPANTALPYLGFKRVTVLTTGQTCSASEAIVNGLQGVGIDVRVIGGTTCGKPYGFSAHDNCGISYFPLEFQGYNAQGASNYTTGFAPTCPVADNVAVPLWNTGDPLVSAAIYNLANQPTGSTTVACPPVQTSSIKEAKGRMAPAVVHSEPLFVRPERQSRVMTWMH